MSKIEKIRAEIERQMKFYDEKEMTAWVDSEQGDEDALWYQGHRKMCAKLLSFIDTLEEEPDKSLEEEIRRYLREDCSSDDEPTTSETARHFAEWGVEHLRDSTKMIDKSLEEAAERFARFYDQGTCDGIIQDGFIAGAQWQEKRNEETIKTAEDHAFLAGADWQKEQMLKDAVDGEVDFEYFGYKVIRPDLKQLDTLLESMNHGDKVRIIIIKEENK